MICLGGFKLLNYIRTQVQQLPPFARRALFMQPGLNTLSLASTCFELFYITNSPITCLSLRSLHRLTRTLRLITLHMWFFPFGYRVTISHTPIFDNSFSSCSMKQILCPLKVYFCYDNVRATLVIFQQVHDALLS